MNRPTMKQSRTAGRTKHRTAYKPKIRWELLGLSDPEQDKSTVTIESIRAQVSTLTREGFRAETRAENTLTAPHTGTRKKPSAKLSAGPRKNID